MNYLNNAAMLHAYRHINKTFIDNYLEFNKLYNYFFQYVF